VLGLGTAPPSFRLPDLNGKTIASSEVACNIKRKRGAAPDYPEG
jgi:hypothetical protein